MENQSAHFPAPTSENVTVMRKRPREYLTEAEIKRLTVAARDNRYGHHDATAILVVDRHALRSSELVMLRWDDVDFTTGRLHVRRAKGEEAAVHPSVAGYQRMVARAGEAASFPS
jgi:type 1 fimbriae regulatory protein FimB/type 1 fimbriae regulatory protein FimE